MARRRLVRAAALAALLALAACSGDDGTPASLRTADGPTTTSLAGAGYDGTGQGIAGAGAGSDPVQAAPGGAAAGQAGAPSTTSASGSPAAPGTTGAPTTAGAGSAGIAAGPGTTSPPGSGGSPSSSAPAGSGGTSPAPAGGRADGDSGAVSGGTSAAPPGRSADPAAYCQAQRTLDSRLAAVDADAGPGPLRTSVATARAAIGPARDTAPADVRGDVEVVTDAYEVLFVALDEAGYDVSKVSVGVFAGISPGAIDAASGRIAAYLSANC